MSSPTDEELARYVVREHTDMNRNVQNANQTELALCGQIMLISTVFLTIIAVSIGANDANISLSEWGKVFILFCIASVLFSIYCGINYYQTMYHFFEKWGGVHSERLNKLGLINPSIDSGMWNKKADELNALSDNLDTVADKKWFMWQLYALLGASISIILFALDKLFM